MVRILFVDDQQRELDGMTKMMNWEELGIEVAGAVTEASAALELVHALNIDIVVTDVIMQNMDGLTLVQELKRREPAVRTICISGFDDFKFVSMAINNGASGYLLKPILVNEMRAVIERVAGEIRREREKTFSLDRGRLALMCMNAKDWHAGLGEGLLAKQVRVVHSAQPVQGALCSLEMEDGGCVSLVEDGAELPDAALASDALPLQRAQEGYAQLENRTRGGIIPGDEIDAVETIKQNIEDHLDEDVGIGMLLENVYLSRGYASALFKRATGMTIHRYVVQRRLERAVELLVSEPGARVKEIALRCGFADASHLINSFQKAYGMTPDKFRRRSRQ